MAQDNNNLIWIDMEISGLSPENDRIIEVALVVTDSQLNVVAEAPVLGLSQPEQCWTVWTTGISLLTQNPGSWTRSDLSQLERKPRWKLRMIMFLQEHIAAGISPMCGNSTMPGPAFSGALDAATGIVLSLSKSGRQPA